MKKILFILTEQILNGTVAFQILVSIVVAADFQTAVAKVKTLPNFSKATITNDEKYYFSYCAPNVIGHKK